MSKKAMKISMTLYVIISKKMGVIYCEKSLKVVELMGYV